MGSWEENFLDKDDFDMDWKAIEKPLITYSKIINDEDNEITIILNECQWEWASIFEKFENVNCNNEWFCFNLYLLDNGLDLIFGYLMYWI